MSSIYCTLTNPTVVSHSISIKFINRSETNLVLAKRNLLQIFRLEKREEDLTSAEHGAEEQEESAANQDDFIGAGLAIRTSERQIVSKLILVAEYILFGTVTSLGAIRTKEYDETGLEYLLVSCEVAKVSLLRWNSDSNSVVSVSLHSFERDEYRSPLVSPQVGSMRIDSLSRVATMSIFGNHLAFMPISQKDELLMDEQEEDTHEHGPIANSFVLSTTQLEEDVTQLLDFTFVEGYREPALALLYASEGTATGLLANWRRDTSKLVVLTLDIQAGARTAIFKVVDLPADLKSVVAVPNPIGGCLLLGTNEIIYVDSASRVVALAVNAYTKRSTGLPMRDYSHLNLSLEGCSAVPLQDGEALDGILLILLDGRFCLLTLNLDGRTVSSLHLKIVSDNFGGDCLGAGATCATLFSGKRLFVGCSTGDSKLLAWRKKARASDQSSSGNGVVRDAVLDVNEEEENENKMDDLDELYGDETMEKKLFGAEITAFDLRFYAHDTMVNHGPVTGMTLGVPYTAPDDDRQDGLGAAGELVTSSGSGSAGKLTIHKQCITPDVIGKFDSHGWRALWTVKVRRQTTEIDEDVSNSLDTYLMASGEDKTQVFTIDTEFVEKTDSEFETSDSTVHISTLLHESCIVQICPDMMRTYDSDLKLLEMKSTPEDCSIISASIADPYVLLVLDNAQLALYSGSSKTKELVEISHSMNGASPVVCATLYKAAKTDSIFSSLFSNSTTNKKRKRGSGENGHAHNIKDDCLCFTVTADDQLIIYALPSQTIVFSCAKLAYLMDSIIGKSKDLHEENTGTASTTSHPMPIVEILVGDLGQHVRTPCLLLRNRSNDVIVYRPYIGQNGDVRFHKHTQSIRRSTHVTPTQDLDQSKTSFKVESPVMTLCDNVGGYSSVFVNDVNRPCWLMKTDQSLPTFHVSGIKDVRSLSGFNTMDAENGFIYCDTDSIIRICRLPKDFNYNSCWGSKSIPVGRSVHCVTYYPPQQVYAIVTSEEGHFEIPDEDDEEWQPLQEHQEELPLLSHSSVELIDARTFAVIDKYELADNEQGMCLRSVNLTVATEYTKKKRPCLALSTGILRGEDLAMRGAVYVFDVVEVVPEVGNPDAKFRLKNVCREEVKAAVTTLCEVDGYLVSAQGQKVVVRSLEEDERLTPVAFVDLGLATTTAKCLRSMLLFGDIQKSVRLVGFGEEPYKMTNFGRDYEAMDVTDAEFMVDGKNLYFTAADSLGNIRLLQYDPENSTSIAGQRLLLRADIHAGHVISTMVLLPMTSKGEVDTSIEQTMVICAAMDGSLSAMIPISERSYRRLYTIQAQLTSSEVQIAGLNPRAYRLSTTEGLMSNPARGILDGPLLSSFAQLDRTSQTQLAQKSGVGADNVLSDLSQLLEGMQCL